MPGAGMIRDKDAQSPLTLPGEVSGAIDAVMAGVEQFRRVTDVEQVGRGKEGVSVEAVVDRSEPTYGVRNGLRMYPPSP
jgi:hypothetical protein